MFIFSGEKNITYLGGLIPIDLGSFALGRLGSVRLCVCVCVNLDINERRPSIMDGWMDGLFGRFIG